MLGDWLRLHLSELKAAAVDTNTMSVKCRGGRTLHVDPLVLAAISPFFRQCLDVKDHACEPVMVIPDLDLSDLSDALCVLFTTDILGMEIKQVRNAFRTLKDVFFVPLEFEPPLEMTETDVEDNQGSSQTLSDVDIHSLSNETLEANFTDQNSRLVCLVCYKIFPPGGHQKYKEHLEGHSKSSLKRIEFRRNAAPRRRPPRRTPRTKETFKCEKCQKQFTNFKLFSRHTNLKICSDESRRCPVCDKVFTDKTRLKVHARLHRGERPYPCRYCDKTFTQGRSRLEHELTHESERRFGCQYCPSRFVQKNHLRYHLASVHGYGGVHRCDVCHKSFAFPFQMRRHQQVHGKR